MTYFQFQDPWLFSLLLLIPLTLFYSARSRQARLRFSDLSVLIKFRSTRTAFIAAIPAFIRCLAIILLVAALARPQEGRKSTEILSAGVDIILAIDTSGSMRATDFESNGQPIDRLTAVKGVVSRFIEGREFDRMGMVVFGAEAFTQCPLTLDHSILHGFLEKLTIGIAGDATAIGSAIGISVKRLKELASKSKVIVLLTDGRNNAGNITPAQAAEVAKIYGVKIYSVGMGTSKTSRSVFDRPFSQRSLMQKAYLDETTLRQIAEITGGQYFKATDADSLQKIYATIDELETSEVRWIDHSEYNELYPYFLIPAMLLLLIESLLSNLVLVRVP